MSLSADDLGLLAVAFGGAAPDIFKIGQGKKTPFPPGHESAKAVLEHLVDFAKGVYLAEDATAETQVRPMIVVCCANGEVFPMVNTSAFDPDEKDAWAALCRKMFKVWNVKHYGMIVEAWAAEPKQEDLNRVGKVRPDYTPPSEREDRREVLMISAEDRRGRTIARTLELVRDFETGKVVELRPWMQEVMDAPEYRMAGRFSTLFGEPEPISEPEIHPTKRPEVLDAHKGMASMLYLIMAMDELGDQREQLHARARDIAGRLMLHFDRMQAVPLSKFNDAPDVKDYNRAAREVQALIQDILPFMPESVQQNIRDAKKKMEH